MDASDAGDKRHQNVYVRLPDGVAVSGPAPPLLAKVSTTITTTLSEFNFNLVN